MSMNELERLYAVSGRAAARRGVPMVLTVVDERRGRSIPAVAQKAVRDEAARRADQATQVHSTLCAGMRADDYGATINTLSVISDDVLGPWA